MSRPETEDTSWSPIWLVPLAALLIGVWMVYDNIASQGPLVTISFATAEGLEAGKTRIKTRSVDIGTVESVSLNESMDGISVTARIDKSAALLLTDDARFWVVRPRIGSGGISGLGTLLSGAYIELDPGSLATGRRRFTGLEDIPPISSSTPGLTLNLFSDSKQSLSVADPVLFRGFNVGQVESVEFDPQKKLARYQIFIQSPYDSLVSSNTHFWNVAGIELNATAEGINISTGSLETLLSGGITFAVPPDLPTGSLAIENAEYRLYDDRKAAFHRRYQYQAEYLILLEDSVRGLTLGAPVEYRGIRIGSVAKVNIENIDRSAKNQLDKMIPVLIHLEPGRIGYGDTQEGTEKFKQDFVFWIAEGLSARLETGNLISGSQFVSLNFHDGTLMDFPSEYGGYSIVPTSQDGFGQITSKVESLLDKMNSLPLEVTMTNANRTLVEAEGTLRQLTSLTSRVDSILKDDSTQKMPEQLIDTLDQLNKTLAGFSPKSDTYRHAKSAMRELQQLLSDLQPLIKELNNKPSALLFSQPRSADPEPKAGQ